MNILPDQGAVAFFAAWQTYKLRGRRRVFPVPAGDRHARGPLIGSQPALTLGDATVSFFLGVTLYGEQPRAGFWLVPALLGLSVLLYGIFGLSHTRCLARCVDRSRDELGDLGEPAAARG